MDKDLKKIVEALREQGFEIEVTSKQHVMAYRDGRFIVTSPARRVTGAP
ncbi:nucleotidyltransferase family protein [Agromyces badenianii]|nr:nucleotidyltransferase family protein [Agromyces badenianii]